MITLIWVVGLSLAVSFLCSVLEAVLLSVNHSHVAVMRERGERAGDLLARMQERIDEPISAILTLNTIAHTVGASMGGALALAEFGDEWIALFSALLTLAILLLSEIIPKTIGAAHWKRLAGPAAWTLRGMVIVMKPVLIPLSFFSRLITRDQGSKTTVSRAELEVLAEIGRREGTLDEAEWRVVTNVMNLSEVDVGAVMTPRTDIVAVPVEASVSEAMTLMLDEGHLRMPVFEGSMDRIVGILLARDLWRADREGVSHIREVVRPAIYVPSSKPVEDLLVEMRSNRAKMAIVLDEYGGTAGLATLEDLIEEIVGEIQDEHEEDEPQNFRDVGAGVTRIWGGVTLRDVNERLDLELPEDDFDTIGGFVFGSLNRIPEKDDEVEVEGGTFRVVRMDGRRIEFLRFFPPRDDASDGARGDRDRVVEAPRSGDGDEGRRG
jgi:putative hemolysin